ncbi:MAG: NAD-dependent epimerase/dehydratase family protein [Halalkalicoccus sp.]
MNTTDVSLPSDRTVLVTGGAGFIGSRIAARLAETNDVRVLDTLAGGTRENVPDGARLIEGDVRAESALERAGAGVDLIYHEAAQVSVPRSVERPRESHAVNVDGTLSVLEHARREDARVVVASSCAVYGHAGPGPIAESTAKEPLSPYGIDKLAVDHYARRYHDLYGLPTVVLRYFNGYGPRASEGYAGVIDAFLSQARAGEPITVHDDGSQTRDFVHVTDIVRANLLAAETDAVGEAYNVGTGEAVTIEELAATIRSITESESEIRHVEGRPGDVSHSEADLEKAREGLGYEPTVTLESGLRTLVERRRRRDA